MRNKLYSASMIGRELGISKDYVHKLWKSGKIPAPMYDIDNIKGWDEHQLEKIKSDFRKGN